ncbi:hypothetical protein ACH36K_12180 [Clostridium sp. MB05]|jgi:hypothetical protein
MYYNLICEEIEEATKLVTDILLELHDKYKDNEEIFPKEENDKEK